ncbi:uncharacterized protein LOC121429267 [Lytechinus variegatus]|uniref:uncharacterized protein LOC121429267 n=1 Tax=Lytechinus variegatus TaxID=7654 RepID=UPI001BB141D5|nr:uncharacterized protein LOC121429267 [Lytechinus variegatus]
MDGSEELLLIKKSKADGPNDQAIVSFGWRVYGLTTITLLNVMNFTQQYLLIVTIFGMANELEFGETECQVIKETEARDYLHDRNITGQELCAERGRCSENSTFFLPDVCGIRYTGQGTLYDVLAGPIYLIIQGVAAIPIVGLFQRLSLRPTFAIGILTVLWTLCTFTTGFVENYWAIALLRFFFGIFSGPYPPLALGYLSHIFPKEVHTVVFGIGQYGNLAGYGVSYIFILVSESMGWRWCYIICGGSGLVLAVASCFMVVVQPRGHHNQNENTLTPSLSQLRISLRQIAWSFMVFIILAQTARIAVAYVLSFNITLYLVEYFPDFNISLVGVITIIAAFPSCIFGGMVCDRLRKVAGLRGRIFVTVILMIISFICGVLIFQTNLTSLVISYGILTLVAECVYLTLLSIISDLTPMECKLVVFAIAYFSLHSVAGAINLLITPIASATSFRLALTLLVGTLFGLCLIFLLFGWVTMHIQKVSESQLASRETGKEQRAGEMTENTPLVYSHNGHDKDALVGK